MFGNVNREEHFSRIPSPSSTPTVHEVPSLPQPNQESLWMGIFSVVSRPALSFLQKYIPVLARSPALSDNVPLLEWVGGNFKQNLVEAETAFLGQLDDMPSSEHRAHHLAYLQYQHGNAVLAASDIRTPSWLTVESLTELGIQSATENDLNIRQQSPVGSLAALRGFLSHVFLNAASAQETKSAEQTQVLGGSGCTSDTISTTAKSITDGNWWGGLWGTEVSPQGWLSNLSWSKEKTRVNHNSRGHCFQHGSGTKATVTKPTELFIQRVGGESVDRESAGPTCYKEELMDNGSLQSATQKVFLPSPDCVYLDQWETVSISDSMVIIGAVSAGSEVAVLTPDQDNGYSSLEEEHSTIRMYMWSPPCEELQGISEIREEANTPDAQTSSVERGPEAKASEQGMVGETPAAGSVEWKQGGDVEQEEVEESDVTDSEDEEEAGAASPSSPAPQCGNKAIAYIMGSPCSDDSQSDYSLSEEDDEDDVDDDGFDSEGSSEFSEPVSDVDDPEDGSDSEQADSETERLWNSLCQSKDRYNPMNFTAPLYTTSQASPSTSTATLVYAPSISPREQPPSPLSSGSPEEEFGSEEESGSSDLDEAESLRLWNSFSSFSDPYSPFNFQAPLRTREQSGTESRCKRSSKSSPQSPRHGPAQSQSHSPPRYKAEEAEERLDSGFSETLSSPESHPAPEATAVGCLKVKKVRFLDEVEEFYTSEDNEDRRGPWEELARDRCRFLRRVQEVEESISYIFCPTFRITVYRRLQHHS